MTCVRPKSNNYHTKVKVGLSKNRKTQIVTSSGEINKMPKCTMHDDMNASVIKPHKSSQTGYNNAKAGRYPTKTNKDILSKPTKIARMSCDFQHPR